MEGERGGSGGGRGAALVRVRGSELGRRGEARSLRAAKVQADARDLRRWRSGPGWDSGTPLFPSDCAVGRGGRRGRPVAGRCPCGRFRTMNYEL